MLPARLSTRGSTRLQSRVIGPIGRKHFGVSRALIRRSHLPWFTFFTSVFFLFSLMYVSLLDDTRKEFAQGMKNSISTLNLAAITGISDETLYLDLKAQTGKGLFYTFIQDDCDSSVAVGTLISTLHDASGGSIAYQGLDDFSKYLEEIYKSPEMFRRIIILPNMMPGLDTSSPEAIAVKTAIFKLTSEKEAIFICSEETKAALESLSCVVLVKNDNVTELAVLAGAIVSAYPVLRSKDIPKAVEIVQKRSIVIAGIPKAVEIAQKRSIVIDRAPKASTINE